MIASSRLIVLAVCLLFSACAVRQPLDPLRSDDLRSAQRTFQITVASADAAQAILQGFVKDGLLSPEQGKAMLAIADHVETVARNAQAAMGKLEALTPEARQDIAAEIR